MGRLNAALFGAAVAFGMSGAHAAPPGVQQLTASRQGPPRVIRFSTQVTPFGTSPPRGGTFIASLPIAPNATIGLGRFNSMPRRRLGSEEAPVGREMKKTRRAAVGLSLKF